MLSPHPYRGLALLALLVTGALAQAPAPQVREVQQKVQRRQFAPAAAQAEQLLAETALTAPQRAAVLQALATARGALEGPDAAISIHERIVRDPDLANAARIDALRDISELQIGQQAGKDLVAMDLGPAMATLQRALTLADLNPDDRAAALLNLGDLCQRRDAFDEADGYYATAAALPLSDQMRLRVMRAAASLLVSRGAVERGLALCREQGIDLIDFCRSQGLTTALHAQCLSVLEDASQPDPARWRAFAQLPVLRTTPPDVPALAALGERHLPALVAQDPNRALLLLTQFKRIEVDRYPQFVAWLSPMLLAAPRLKATDREVVYLAWVDAQGLTGGAAAAVESARQAGADVTISPARRLWAQLLVQALTSAGDVQRLLDREPQLSAKDQSDALLAAGRSALRAGEEAAARALLAKQQARFAAPPRAQVACIYVDRAPADIGEWLSSPLLHEAQGHATLARPYGDNLSQLVATDAAMTGRDAADQAAQVRDDAQTDLHVVCDPQGLHLFLQSRDAQVEHVLAGRERGGSFEMYLAPGARQPYYTLLGQLPAGKFTPDRFVTSYPNLTFRAVSEQDGTFRQQVRVMPDGYAVYLFFSWQAFHDKLPHAQTAWPFEVIRWTRSGGFSFAGSRSVHHRSSWGEIVFTGLLDVHRQRMRRQVLFAAAQRYRAARGMTGSLGAWLDPELGDPQFYRTVLQPRVERFDAILQQISPQMTDAQVDQAYLDAVPFWMDMEAHLGALRRAWLEARLFHHEAP